MNDPKTFPSRLLRLAKTIDALGEKDAAALRQASEMTALRRRAAAGLFALCAGFVDALNRVLSRPVVTLDPPAFSPDLFHEGAANRFEIEVRGRVLRIEFQATPELLSTEEFRIPYTLSGTVHAFNEGTPDKVLIEEQLIFYTVERHQNLWRYFDARTYRSGTLDRDYLLGLVAGIV